MAYLLCKEIGKRKNARSYQNSNIKVVTGYKTRITLKDTEQTIALSVNKTHYTFAIITFIIDSYTKNTAITSTRLNNGFSEAVIINSLEGDIIPISINFSENNKMIFKLPKNRGKRRFRYYSFCENELLI